MASGPRTSKPAGYQKHLAGEFREAGWTVYGPPSMLRVKCSCTQVHKTFIREDAESEQYAKDKLGWLFNETCYGGEQ